MSMISTESKQINTNTQQGLIELVYNQIKKEGRAVSLDMCFDIPYKFDSEKYLVLRKMARFLNYCLECDLTITDEYLEKIKLYILSNEC